MSLKRKVDNFWLISHEDYLRRTYRSFHFEPIDIFNIATPFRMDQEAERIAREVENPSPSPAKRKRRCIEMSDLSRRFQSAQILFKKEFLITGPSVQEIRQNNRAVRGLAFDLMKNDDQLSRFVDSADGRPKSQWRTIDLEENTYIIPPEAEFFLTDVRNPIQIKDRLFDIIVMDPPWENKHVKRVNKRKQSLGYDMLTNDQVGELPINSLLSEEGVIFVWCTVSDRHQADIEKWFLNWELDKVATWYWLKVTKYGEFVCSLDNPRKRPYELLLIGRKKSSSCHVPEGQVLMSVPSAIHSHKPPLIDVFEDLLDMKNKRCLEIFGRYLLPKWTTLGNEAVKFQNRRFFSDVSHQ